MKKIIDCHTHIQSETLYEEYFKNRNYYAIAIKALDCLIGNGNTFYEATKNKKNIFICECIDILKPIKPQLDCIKSNLNKYKIIGIKIYLVYQPLVAHDKILFPIYEFAKDNNLSVVFHCGDTAKNLKAAIETRTCSSQIAKVASLYPMVNFIASHFDAPNYDKCAKLVSEHQNVYTDISGEYEEITGKPSSKLMQRFIERIGPIIDKYGKERLMKKIMFGTDYFGSDSAFFRVEEYLETLQILFGKENTKTFAYDNCLNAYPKLKTYIKDMASHALNENEF